ncbi:hypothetical protein ACFX12_008287 [Malus domestica]
MVDLKESLGRVTLAVERERWVRDEACVGTLTLVGWEENKVETLGCWKKWVGRIVERESEREAVAKGESPAAEGTMASGFCSSGDLDSGFSGIWRLASIFSRVLMERLRAGG